jgi:hypothetical protein
MLVLTIFTNPVTASQNKPGVPIRRETVKMQRMLRNASWMLRDRPSDRRLLAKLVQTFANIGCHVVNVTDPYDRNLVF